MSTSRPWSDRPIPPEVARIPAMLSDEERRYLSWVTEVPFEGFGAVVDLGPWLGASTAALAHGLAQSGRDQKVLAYDLFEWRQNYMAGYVDEETARGFDEGQSFLPLFEDQLGPYAGQVEARPGSLLDTTWDDGPIEILFVDAAKDFALTNAILNTFGPALVPGRSRVVSQDFRIHAAYWLPWVFSDPQRWREIEQVEHGSTLTFVPTRPFEPVDLRDEDLTLAIAEQVLRPRIDSEIPVNRVHFANSLYRIAVLRGEDDAARALEPELREHHRSNQQADSLEEVRAKAFAQLLQEGWDALRRGDLETARQKAMAASRSDSATQEARYLQSLASDEGSTERDVTKPGGNTSSVHPATAALLPARLLLTGASALLQTGRPEAAAAEALKALRHDDDPPTGWELRWAFETLEPAWAEAPPEDPLGTLDRLSDRYDEDAPFHLLRALVLNHLGRTAEAREAVACVLAIDEHYRRGQILRDELSPS